NHDYEFWDTTHELHHVYPIHRKFRRHGGHHSWRDVRHLMKGDDYLCEACLYLLYVLPWYDALHLVEVLLVDYDSNRFDSGDESERLTQAVVYHRCELPEGGGNLGVVEDDHIDDHVPHGEFSEELPYVLMGNPAFSDRVSPNRPDYGLERQVLAFPASFLLH